MGNAVDRITLIHLVILGVVCTLVFLLFLGRTPFHDKAEPREALVVRDIVLEGRWLLPLRAGEQIPSKPPLFHWLAAGASILRGEMTEASIRFPSALFGSLGVLLCYVFGRRLYDPQTGLWAGLIIATTALYYAAGIEARVDMTLVFFVTLTLIMFFSIYRGFLRHKIWWYVFFIIAGGSVTAKGPVSVVLCGLVIAAFLVLRNRWDVLRTMLRHPGIVLGSVICLAWYGAALYLAGDEFFGLQFVKENFARFFVHGEGGTGHQKPFYYFIPYLFTLGMPWTLFLPGVIWSYFSDESHRKDDLLFLAVWVVAVFLFFSLSAGKRPPYILPLYPPLALLTAVWLRAQAGGSCGKPGYFKIVAIFAFVIGFVFAAALAVYTARLDIVTILPSLGIAMEENAAVELSRFFSTLHDRRWLVLGFLIVGAALWFSIARNLYRFHAGSAVTQMALVSVVTIAFARNLILPNLANIESYKEFMQLATAAVLSSQSLILFPRGVDPSSIIFYGKDKVEILPDDLALLQNKLMQSKGYFIVEEDTWKSQAAEFSTIPILGRSRGTGPDGDARLVLIRGRGN
jgi:4-amino-4-deoxy-L-arabinose transferase-like glycosyltransferase